MNPYIYEKNDITCSNMGLGVLPDVISCRAVKTLTYQYEIEFTYSVSGVNFDKIKEGRKIKVKPDEVSLPQQFRIYRVTEPLNGMVKVYAQHISYDLSGIPVEPFELDNVNGTTALDAILKTSQQSINGHCVFNSGFTGISDIVTTKTLYSGIPKSARAWLSNNDGGLLNLYGGELEFDNYVIRHKNQIGSNNGVRIAYGKNITEFSRDKKIDDIYTSVYPYAIDNNGTYHELTEKIVSIPSASNYGVEKVLNVDLSRQFESGELITDSKLRAKALDYAYEKNLGILTQNIKISFVPLWQTEEYKDLAALERVSLGDTVIIYYPLYNVNVTARVVKTEYDFKAEKYLSIEIGQIQNSLSDTLSQMNKNFESIKKTVANQQTVNQQMIQHQTDIITGAEGGNVVTKFNSNGQPSETLYMDTDSETTATKVMRINYAGIGFGRRSSGPFSTAWTLDGAFNASFITTGALNANLITTGAINADLITTGTLNANRIKAGVLQDTSNNISINMTTGSLDMKLTSGKMNLWTSGLTFYSPSNAVLASMFVSSAGNGVVTANVGLFGARDSEKVQIYVYNNKGMIKCDELTTDNTYLSSAKAINSIGFSLQASGIEKGSFYLSTENKSILNTNLLYINGEEYEKTAISINGVTYYVLSSGGSA